jgi:ADP-ribose pyrophosphatase
VIRLYLAWDLEEGRRELDADEFVDVVRVPFSQAVEWVRNGTIQDCKSITTILYAAQFVVGRTDGARGPVRQD